MWFLAFGLPQFTHCETDFTLSLLADPLPPPLVPDYSNICRLGIKSQIAFVAKIDTSHCSVYRGVYSVRRSIRKQQDLHLNS